jgi:hypothetical protein
MAVNPSVVRADLEGEAILLDLDTGTYFGLDEVGNAIWKAVEQGASEVQIFDRLAKEYDVDPVQLRSDVADFLSQLQARQLLREVEA